MDLARCYEILSEATAEHGMAAVETLSADETTAILDLARVAAHAVERKAAPLVCYSIGRALADVDAQRRRALLEEVIARIESDAEGEPTAA